MEFKDRFKTLKQSANASLSAVAVEVGKTESAIRAWELGRTKPDVDTLIKLSKYFNCTVDYILGLSFSKNKDENNSYNNLIKQNPELFDYLSKILAISKNTTSYMEKFIYDNFVFNFEYFLRFYLKLSNETTKTLKEIQFARTDDEIKEISSNPYVLEDTEEELKNIVHELYFLFINIELLLKKEIEQNTDN